MLMHAIVLIVRWCAN